MNTATLVRPLIGWHAGAALYQLDPPLVALSERITHVIVSTIPKVNGDHGSIVLAANPDGTVRSWWSLHRSEQDDHASALAELGYQLVTP